MARKRDGSLVFSRFPLVLPHAQIRRMLHRQPQLLILSRRLDADAYEVHDEHTIRRNVRHKKNGLSELQEDPAVCVIEITDVTARELQDLDLVTVRHAGFETLEDFYLEWLKRRRVAIIGLELKLYTYRIAEEARYLHRRVHRGYTRNPAHAVPDEPQAVDRAELDRYATEARDRYVADHVDELARREAKSLANQLRSAHARAAREGIDVGPEIHTIRQQLDQIQSKIGKAAA